MCPLTDDPFSLYTVACSEVRFDFLRSLNLEPFDFSSTSCNIRWANIRAHGVVVSHPLSMREALGSIPSVSRSLKVRDIYLLGSACAQLTHVCPQARGASLRPRAHVGDGALLFPNGSTTAMRRTTSYLCEAANKLCRLHGVDMSGGRVNS